LSLWGITKEGEGNMVFQAKSGVDVEKTVTDTQFKIATNSKLFSILSDSIYTRKIDAVIRELCCNAFDAHVEARQDRKFQLTLPSEFNSEFRVRDFGSGLCESDMQMYTTYGESTKSGSNAYIGAFGIGAKSPFAYTNTFNVTSYHDGVARAYSMFVEDSVPRMVKLGEGPSEEPSGLEVFFPVAVKDIDEFKNKAVTICALMADKIEFLQANDRWLAELDLEVKKYNWIPADYLGAGYATSEFKIDIDHDYNYLYIIQGNVCYEMSVSEVAETLRYALGREYDRTINRLKTNFYISGFLRVPNGTFVPHPSRERLTFDEITKGILKDIFSKVFEYHVDGAVDRVLEGVKSYYDLHQRLRDISRLVSSNSKIIEFSNDDQNILTGPHLVHNYDEWRKLDFPCVQITGGNDKTYRFKSIPQMNMYGDRIDRIFYTNKYPLAEKDRYRILKDKIQAESKNSIILSGNISKMFTEDDKAFFVNVQSLPKLTPEDLLNFKKRVGASTGSGIRVTKEEVSFLTVDALGERFYQQPADKILDMLVDFPVYWVGSNKRYEFQLGNTLFHLKVQGDKDTLLRQYFGFFLEYIAPDVPIVKKGKMSQFGVAVLPEDHPLRDVLPELENSLIEGIRSVVTDFMNKTFYKIDLFGSDLLFDRLIKHPELLLQIITEFNGKDFKDFFSDWISAGMPKPVQKVKQSVLPFQLLPNDERDLLQKDYNSSVNIKILSIRNLYEWLGGVGFPVLRSFSWNGVSDDALADDLIDYVINKAGRLLKDGN
jgi:hypothetical protein